MIIEKQPVMDLLSGLVSAVDALPEASLGEQVAQLQAQVAALQAQSDAQAAKLSSILAILQG